MRLAEGSASHGLRSAGQTSPPPSVTQLRLGGRPSSCCSTAAAGRQPGSVCCVGACQLIASRPRARSTPGARGSPPSTCAQHQGPSNLPGSGQDGVAGGVQGGGNRRHPAAVAAEAGAEGQSVSLQQDGVGQGCEGGQRARGPPEGRGRLTMATRVPGVRLEWLERGLSDACAPARAQFCRRGAAWKPDFVAGARARAQPCHTFQPQAVHLLWPAIPRLHRSHGWPQCPNSRPQRPSAIEGRHQLRNYRETPWSSAPAQPASAASSARRSNRVKFSWPANNGSPRPHRGGVPAGP
jgi:hypothetical protein